MLFAASATASPTAAYPIHAQAIRRTAKDHIPPEFQNAFLNRNPVNRELLTRATRLK